jgi:hypothetical protein
MKENWELFVILEWRMKLKELKEKGISGNGA